VENVHAGAGAAYRLTHRRFTTRQVREVIRSTAERMTSVLGVEPAWAEELLDLTDPWPQRLAGLPYTIFYPFNWSMDESSSQIVLKKEWCQ
jgi:hypothetical protein